MWNNYLKIAYRNIKKNKVYSFINITGLAIGVATCLMILLFVQDELNYDKYNKKADRIYRVIADMKFGGNSFNTTNLGAPSAERLVDDYPEVEKAVRIQTTGSRFIKYGDRSFKETNVIKADSTLFDIFTIPFLHGNPKTALRKPNTLVLSKKMADKYFGDENPVGKMLILNNRDDFLVTGVFKNIPSNSHFHPDFIISLQIQQGGDNDYWLSNMSYVTYLLLRENFNYKNFEAKLPAVVEKYMGPEIGQFTGKSIKEFFAEGNKAGLVLQPLTDIHLYSDLMGELEPNGDIKYVIIFSAIAIFILMIACINFMDLSTATSSQRAKEVGIKKVLGSDMIDLIKQFLTESIVMSLLATILALVIIQLMLPFFNNLAGKELTISYIKNYQFLAGILMLTLFIGILAGIYPALFISSFKPIAVLKGKLRTGSKSGLFRSSLVVFQFTASIVMMTATTVVFNQLNYIQNKKLGFNKEHKIVIHDSYILGEQVHSFKNETISDSRIISGTIASTLPIGESGSSNATIRDRNINDEKMTAMQSWSVDEDYIPTLGMKILKGRNFSKEFGNDSSAVIINEAVAKHFEWDDPIGKQLSQYTSLGDNPLSTYNVIGVVKDFHYESMKNSIGPVLMFLRPSSYYSVFRFNGENMTEVINYLKSKWESFAPGSPFEYSFLDRDFDNLYKAEQKIGDIFSVFAFLAIFIGCLGLFGLAAFTAEQKTKEIGIRKVLGASIAGLIYLLSKEFAKLISLAFLISIPIAYYFMNNWLQDFTYRVEINWWVFGLSGGMALLIALTTVSYHAFKSATANPVDSLRNE
ncbi:MAG: ABC transporter permease [Melioribacteraceae bacterium]|nr:ABC transporter permease [Melioribacteraceae bacterium]